jgi:hypothetical protein
MRWAGAIAILLILLILSAGCGQRVPKGSSANTTPGIWGGQRPREYNGSSGPGVTMTGTPLIATPTTAPPGAVVPATTIPVTTVTITPSITYRKEPGLINLTANYTIVYEQDHIFTWNATALTYEIKNPPLIIDVTLTVPNVTRTSIDTDPVSGADITVTSTYPDPQAYFEMIVRDPVTKRVFAQGGFGRQYDVSYHKQLKVLYPGTYHIQMNGNKVTAHVKFTVPRVEET